MKISFKMIRVGLTATLCAGLLAACDNRSVTPFKSKTWTKEEIALNKALQDGHGPNAPTNTDGAISTSGGGLAALPDGESPLVTPKPLPQPGKEDQTVNTGSAQSKFGVEFAKREKDQQKSSKADVLTAVVDEALKRMDPDAALLVPMISVKVEGSSSAYGLTIKAALNLAGHPVYLLVDQATVTAPIDGDVAPLAAELHADKAFQDKAQPIGNSLYVWAFTPANQRDLIYLILDMKQPSGVRKNAVFALQKGSDGKFTIINSNIGNAQDIKAFEEAAKADDNADKSGEGQAGETALPKSDKGVIENGDTKSQNPADAGTAGKDAPSSGQTEDKGAVAPATPEKQGSVQTLPNPAGRAVVDTKGSGLLGAAPDVTKRGVPATRVNLAELSANKNTPVKFAVKTQDQANTKSVMFKNAAAATTATAAVAKTAPAARIDVTQVVKSRASLTANGVDAFARNKALGAQTQIAAAKPTGKATLTTTAAATSATTPAATAATTTSTATTATTTATNQSLRLRAAKAAQLREAARKTNDGKTVTKSAEAK